MPETTQASFVIEASVRDGFYAVKDAFIKIHGPMPPLGYFDCPAAAHLAYVLASAKLHGEFGRIQ